MHQKLRAAGGAAPQPRRNSSESRHTCNSLAVEYLRQNLYMITMNEKFTGGKMCPACIASAAAMVAGGGSAGGVVAVCLGKFRRYFRGNRLGLFHKTQEK
jgi:hypothetical protein